MRVMIVALSLVLIFPASFSGSEQGAAALKGVPQFAADPKWPTLPADFT